LAGDFTLVPSTSGYCLSTEVTTRAFSDEGTSYSGTAASANSGSGGGGSISPDNAAFAPGGNGGSGYLEITWQE
jgi:hypothetical protein